MTAYMQVEQEASMPRDLQGRPFRPSSTACARQTCGHTRNVPHTARIPTLCRPQHVRTMPLESFVACTRSEAPLSALSCKHQGDSTNMLQPMTFWGACRSMISPTFASSLHIPPGRLVSIADHGRSCLVAYCHCRRCTG